MSRSKNKKNSCQGQETQSNPEELNFDTQNKNFENENGKKINEKLDKKHIEAEESPLPVSLHLLRQLSATNNPSLRKYNCEKIKTVFLDGLEEELVLIERKSKVQEENINNTEIANGKLSNTDNKKTDRNKINSKGVDLLVEHENTLLNGLFGSVPLLTLFLSAISDFVLSKEQEKRNCGYELAKLIPRIVHRLLASHQNVNIIFEHKNIDSLSQEKIRSDIDKDNSGNNTDSSNKNIFFFDNLSDLDPNFLYAQPDTFAKTDLNISQQKKNISSSLGVETAMVGKNIIDEVLSPRKTGSKKNTSSKSIESIKQKNISENDKKNKVVAASRDKGVKYSVFVSSFDKKLANIQKKRKFIELLNFFQEMILSEYWYEREGSLLFFLGILQGTYMYHDIAVLEGIFNNSVVNLKWLASVSIHLIKYDKFTDYQEDVSTTPVRLQCARIIGEIFYTYGILFNNNAENVDNYIFEKAQSVRDLILNNLFILSGDENWEVMTGGLLCFLEIMKKEKKNVSVNEEWKSDLISLCFSILEDETDEECKLTATDILINCDIPNFSKNFLKNDENFMFENDSELAKLSYLKLFILTKKRLNIREWLRSTVETVREEGIFYFSEIVHSYCLDKQKIILETAKDTKTDNICDTLCESYVPVLLLTLLTDPSKNIQRLAFKALYSVNLKNLLKHSNIFLRPLNYVYKPDDFFEKCDFSNYDPWEECFTRGGIETMGRGGVLDSRMRFFYLIICKINIDRDSLKLEDDFKTNSFLLFDMKTDLLLEYLKLTYQMILTDNKKSQEPFLILAKKYETEFFTKAKNQNSVYQFLNEKYLEMSRINSLFYFPENFNFCDENSVKIFSYLLMKKLKQGIFVYSNSNNYSRNSTEDFKKENLDRDSLLTTLLSDYISGLTKDSKVNATTTSLFISDGYCSPPPVSSWLSIICERSEKDFLKYFFSIFPQDIEVNHVKVIGKECSIEYEIQDLVDLPLLQHPLKYYISNYSFFIETCPLKVLEYLQVDFDYSSRIVSEFEKIVSNQIVESNETLKSSVIQNFSVLIQNILESDYSDKIINFMMENMCLTVVRSLLQVKLDSKMVILIDSVLSWIKEVRINQNNEIPVGLQNIISQEIKNLAHENILQHDKTAIQSNKFVREKKEKKKIILKDLNSTLQDNDVVSNENCLLSTMGYALFSRLIPLITSETPYFSLVDPVRLENYTISPSICLKLRSYQSVTLRWLNNLRKLNLNGILADEMGLGKTVQIMCYILTEIDRDSRIIYKEEIENDQYKSIKSDIYQPGLRNVLILCPPSLTGHWQNEIHRMCDRHEFTILTRRDDPKNFAQKYFFNQDLECYSRISDKEVFSLKNSNYRIMTLCIASYDTFRANLKISEIKWDYLVLDEGHLLKNNATALYSKLNTLNPRNICILTGTPVQNSPSDLFNLFELLNPGYLQNKKEVLRLSKKCTGNSCTENDLILLDQEMGLLKRKIAPFVLRRLKKSVLKDLPDKIIKDVIVEMEYDQRSIYDSVSRMEENLPSSKVESIAIRDIETDTDDENKTDSNAREAQTAYSTISKHSRLLKLCSFPQLINKTGSSAKMSALKELYTTELQESESKILIFCRSSSTIDLIIGEMIKSKIFSSEEDDKQKKRLKVTNRNSAGSNPPSEDNVDEEDYLWKSNYLVLDSSKKDKQFVIDQFWTGQYKTLLLTTQIGSLGLNLSISDTVIFFEHSYNPFVDLQAMDRVHRIGQENVVNVIRLLVKDSIEERVMNLQCFKRYVARSVIEEGQHGFV